MRDGLTERDSCLDVLRDVLEHGLRCPDGECAPGKSGKPHITPLVFLKQGDEMFIVGSLAGYDEDPAWVKNLRARPECKVQLDREKTNASAREVTDSSEREALWPKLRQVFPSWYYFQHTTPRPFGIFALKSTGPAT